MLFYRLLLFGIITLVYACTATQPNKTIALPKAVEETSGLATVGEDFVTHNDSGDDALLYRINKQGELIDTYPILGAINRDWEDLAQDDSIYYIADTGNNHRKRKDLTIYRLTKDFHLLDSITIRYAKQKSSRKTRKPNTMPRH